MKIQILLSVIFLIALCIPTLSSCAFINRRLSSNMLANTFLDLNDANGLGILRNRTRNPLVRNGSNDDGRNWLAIFDENGNIEEVVFYRYVRDGETEEITQVRLPAPIVQLHSTQRWTFMMFSVRSDYPSINVQQGSPYSGFVSNARYGNQTFVVENETGRIFHLPTSFDGRYGSVEALDDLIMFEYWWDSDRDDNVREDWRRFYVLDVVDDELVFNRIFGTHDNNNIDYVIDKFGQFFVATDFDGIEGDVLYHSGGPTWEQSVAPLTGTRFGRGNDGYVYKVTISGSRQALNRQYSIKRVGEGFDFFEIDEYLEVSIRFGTMQFDNRGSLETLIIRNRKLFSIYLDNGHDITVANFSDGVFREYRRITLPGGHRSGADFARINIYNTEVFYVGRFDEDSLRLGETSTLYHFCLLTEIETVVMDGVHWAETRRQGMFIYNGARFGVDSVPIQYYATRIYRMTFEDGRPVPVLSFGIPDDVEVVTLQPL